MNKRLIGALATFMLVAAGASEGAADMVGRVLETVLAAYRALTGAIFWHSQGSGQET